MVQAETSGKTCFDIGEALPVDAERTTATIVRRVSHLYKPFLQLAKSPALWRRGFSITCSFVLLKNPGIF